ncbi:bifunctional ADP-dependent NAD(P)H-hydrate dehydratase/NAD(P)H-hydrate epimerase [Thermaerobacter litoralis]
MTPTAGDPGGWSGPVPVPAPEGPDPAAAAPAAGESGPGGGRPEREGEGCHPPAPGDPEGRGRLGQTGRPGVWAGPGGSLWVLSAAATRQADRRAMALGLDGLVMMETAGRTAAALLWQLAGPFTPRRPVVVLAGAGNNGGDGMVLARWLARWAGPGAVEVFLLASPGRLRGEAAVQGSLLGAAGVPVTALADEPAGGEGLGGRGPAAQLPDEPAGGDGPGGREPVAQAAGSLPPDAFLDRLGAAVARAPVVVDALLGVGARGPLRPLAARALEVVSASGVPIFALDLPSGLDADTGEAGAAVPRARWTVTFGAVKWGLLLGQGPERAGRVFVADIGWPPGVAGRGPAPEPAGGAAGGPGEGAGAGGPAGASGDPAAAGGPGFPPAQVLDAAGVAALLPRRPWDAHKGWAGHVVVAGGRAGQVGAVVLAGRAALQAGAGTVTLAVPAPVRSEAAVHLPEIMTWGLPGTPDGEWDPGAAAALPAREAERRGRVVRVIGPGLGQGPGAAACVAAWLGLEVVAAGPPAGDRPAAGPGPGERQPGPAGLPPTGFPPTVLDADGLNLVAALGLDRLRQRPGPYPLVLTPHPGEAARLLGWSTGRVQAQRPLAAQELARRAGAVAVLKGAGTLIASPEGDLYACTRGHPGMASAGMGDVLAGVVGALLAQGLDPLAAALAGVYLHALAGERAAAAPGLPVRATQLIDRLADALALIRWGGPEAGEPELPGVVALGPSLDGAGAWRAREGR